MEVRSLYEVHRLREGIVSKNAYAELRTKGHNVYFVDLGRLFGFSMCVFYNGAHCHSANKYQSDWYSRNITSREGLMEIYIKFIHNSIFTDDELGVVASYEEYRNKHKFLVNIYPLRKPSLSIFEIEDIHFGNADDFIYDDYAFAYYYKADSDFVNHHRELYRNLAEIEREAEEDYYYIRDGFLTVMRKYKNNSMLDYNTLSEFGIIHNYRDGRSRLDNYFDSLGFTEMKRSAYLSAKDEYRKIYN